MNLSEPVTEHQFSLRCFPQDNERQRILSLQTEVSPVTKLQYATDWAGNREAHGVVVEPHQAFTVLVTGQAETGAGIFESYRTEVLRNYQYPTPLTAPGQALREFLTQLHLEAENGPYPKALKIMRELHRALVYRPGKTDVATTAEEAFAAGQGVCQDYAHSMVALCRAAGLPCKYIAGLMQGEGESHAWVEVLCRGYWYGFDPTNDLLVCDGYLKFSEGRDFTDCTISKGSFRGTAKQTQTVAVRMHPAD